MRRRSKVMLAAATLGLFAPATGLALGGSYGGGIQLTYMLDGPSVELAPANEHDGTYALSQRLWSKRQNVQWFTVGPPPAIGSVSVTKFASRLAHRAPTDGATAPVAHISYVQNGHTRHFLATVSVASAGLGRTKAPTLTAALSPMSAERLTAIASGKGLLSKIAARCLKTITATSGATCITSAPITAALATGFLKNSGNYDPDSLHATVSVG